MKQRSESDNERWWGVKGYGINAQHLEIIKGSYTLGVIPLVEKEEVEKH